MGVGIVTQLYKKNGSVFIPVGITVEEVEKLKELYNNYTKAKELIKDFILMAKVEHLKDRYETVDEAEQFLNNEMK